MKRLVSKISSIMLFVTLGMGASAQTVVTLDDCRRMAVDNNANVAIARRNAEAAEQVRKEAFTKYFPSIEATGMAFATSRPVVNYDIMDIANIQMVKNGIGLGVTATQPVFAGGRIVNGNKLASVGARAGHLQEEGAVNNAIVTVEQYYWELVALKAKKQTLESVITMVDTIQRQVEVAVKAGIVTRNDLLKVELKRNEYRSLMVDLDNGINLSQQRLAQYIGMDGQPIDVADAGVPEVVPPYPAQLYMEPSESLPVTTDYRLLQAQVDAADLKSRMVVGENLPTVGVGAGYYYDDIINQPNHFGAVFVAVNIPISGWWGGSHAIKKSRIEKENAQSQLDDLSQMLKLRMSNAWDDLTAAHRKMTIAAESIDQSTENLRLSQNYYDAGVSSITDLLDAQTLYRQSLDQYTESYANFRIKEAAYIDATGRTQAPTN